MTTLKFANILLENNARSAEYPALYCRGSKPWHNDGVDEGCVFPGGGIYDFTTYFNALSVEKLKRYTSATGFSLTLETKGASFSYIQTTADVFSSSPREVQETSAEIPESSEWTVHSFDLLAEENPILVGFKIVTSGDLYIRSGSYSIEFDHKLRDVELMLSTTTFKKEDYIKANIAKIKDEVLGSSEDIASHFRMFVVDNGRTLDESALEGDGVSICPNDNVGGAGGFTRGMIEALEASSPVTHILLMDDDVSISPESIIRTYNLLRAVNDDYSSAFISGAMLSHETADEQWEDTGYMTPEGTFSPAKPPLRLTKFEDLVYNDAYRVPGPIKNLHQRYAAWWYCAIPLGAIRGNGLPLPYFVRCDDAEFGVRCSPEFMTMNGIGIWHDSFHYRYNAAVERYQTTRNTMIAQFTTGFSPNSDFMHELNRNMYLELKKFGYDNAELLLDAFEDFMRGPEFYSAPGVAEKTFMDANRNKEKLYPLSEVEKQAHKLGLVDFKVVELSRQLIDGDRPRAMAQRFNDYLTNNGQRFFVTQGNGYAVIPNVGWAYPAGAIRGKKYLIVIDWYNRVGAVRVKDPVRYKSIEKRYKADLRRFKANKNQLREAYAASREKVTSVAFWKNYLGMTD